MTDPAADPTIEAVHEASETHSSVAMTAEQIMDFLRRDFPQSLHMGFSITEVSEASVTMLQPAGYDQLRPGGTISGPTMMALADCAAYLAILSRLGPIALAVTTHLSIDFLRKPAPGALLAHASLLKLGKRLAVIRVDMASQGAPNELVATASVTYSLPPRA